MNKQTDLTGQHSFTMFYFVCLYVADPATFLVYNSVCGTLFSLVRTACLLSYENCIVLLFKFTAAAFHKNPHSLFQVISTSACTI